jgi:hypothetical protein
VGLGRLNQKGISTHSVGRREEDTRVCIKVYQRIWKSYASRIDSLEVIQ